MSKENSKDESHNVSSDEPKNGFWYFMTCILFAITILATIIILRSRASDIEPIHVKTSSKNNRENRSRKKMTDRLCTREKLEEFKRIVYCKEEREEYWSRKRFDEVRTDMLTRWESLDNGIVIYCQDNDDVENAYVLCNLLKFYKSKTPILLWSKEQIRIDRVCDNTYTLCLRDELQSGSYSSKKQVNKFLALYLSRMFTNILYLDSHLRCVQNIDHLFDIKGNYFWNDYWKLNTNAKCYSIFPDTVIKRDTVYSTDAGQFLVHHPSCIDSLYKTYHVMYNDLHSIFPYPYSESGKDVLRIMNDILSISYQTNLFSPGFIGYSIIGTRFESRAMTQYDVKGDLLFIHPKCQADEKDTSKQWNYHRRFKGFGTTSPPYQYPLYPVTGDYTTEEFNLDIEELCEKFRRQYPV